MSSLLQSFYQKIDFLYSEFAVSGDCYTLHCELCDSKIQENWIDHWLSEVHCAAVNHIAEQLIDVFLSHSILLRKKTEDGFCVLCSENLTNFTNCLIHLNSSNHQEKMEKYKTEHEDSRFRNIYKACCISDNGYEDDLTKKIICNGIVSVEERGMYYCNPCDLEITNNEQFCSHITGSAHLEFVIDQLCLAAVMIEVHKGITIKNGSFFCMLCRTVLGSGLAAAKEIPVHISSCQKDSSSCESDSIEDYLSSDSFSSDGFGI